MASTDEPVQEPTAKDVSLPMEMSRGLEADVQINFEDIRELNVINEEGNPIRFGDLYKDKRAIIVLVRHFLCFTCTDYVEDLAKIPETYLQDADTRLVVIGCAPYKFIQPFRDATGYRYELYVDPERQLYKKLGCLEKMKYGELKESKHIKSNFLSGTLKATWRGMKFCEFQGDTNQQGASFVIGPGDNLIYGHLDTASSDHAPINDLLGHADVAQVNYPKDKRVMVI